MFFFVVNNATASSGILRSQDYSFEFVMSDDFISDQFSRYDSLSFKTPATNMSSEVASTTSPAHSSSWSRNQPAWEISRRVRPGSVTLTFGEPELFSSHVLSNAEEEELTQETDDLAEIPFGEDLDAKDYPDSSAVASSSSYGGQRPRSAVEEAISEYVDMEVGENLADLEEMVATPAGENLHDQFLVAPDSPS